MNEDFLIYIVDIRESTLVPIMENLVTYIGRVNNRLLCSIIATISFIITWIFW